MFCYAGINCCSLFTKSKKTPVMIEQFELIDFANLTKFEIGWNFCLLWVHSELYISGNINENGTKNEIEKLSIPGNLVRYKFATVDSKSVCIITEDDEIWQYKVYSKEWKKVPKFLVGCDENQKEIVIQLITTQCTLALTNLGRVYSIPTLIEMPKRQKFVHIASGFDHAIMLAESGSVFSMGLGTRGQLGHGDLEDCESPKEIKALAGLKVVQISAGGWHSAVVTDQGDLYTWGWNTTGELGIPTEDVKICATPRVVDFKDEESSDLEVNVKKVECGNNFTICMTDDATLWGCGSNKYGQLGQSTKILQSSSAFFKLTHHFDNKKICDFQCREWGTCIITD